MAPLINPVISLVTRVGFSTKLPGLVSALRFSLCLSDSIMSSKEMLISQGHWGKVNDSESPHFGSEPGNPTGQCMGQGRGRVLPSEPELHDSAVDRDTPGPTVRLPWD